MKQHITTEQLQELTPEQQKALRNWWKDKPGDLFYRTDGDSRGIWRYNEYHFDSKPDRWSLPILSIGQCIELLNGTRIDIKRSGLNNPFVFNDKQYPELIDALWEAVKEIL